MSSKFRSHLVSQALRFFSRGFRLKRRLRKFLRSKINGADPNGPFSQLTGKLHRLPIRILVELLRIKGYDGLIFEEVESGEIQGSCFFQKRGVEEIHIFDFGLEAGVPDRTRLRVLLGLITEVVDWAARQAAVERVFIGVGNNEETMKIYGLIRNHPARFGVNVIRDGCYELCRGEVVS